MRALTESVLYSTWSSQLGSLHVVPQTTPSLSSVVPQTTPSSSVVPQTTPSSPVVPQTTPSLSVVPQTTPSPSFVPQTPSGPVSQLPGGQSPPLQDTPHTTFSESGPHVGF